VHIVSWLAEEDATAETAADSNGKGKYVLESLRGFHLFPQTAHVKSAAVLRLVYYFYYSSYKTVQKDNTVTLPPLKCLS